MFASSFLLIWFVNYFSLLNVPLFFCLHGFHYTLLSKFSSTLVSHHPQAKLHILCPILNCKCVIIVKLLVFSCGTCSAYWVHVCVYYHLKISGTLIYNIGWTQLLSIYDFIENCQPISNKYFLSTLLVFPVLSLASAEAFFLKCFPLPFYDSVFRHILLIYHGKANV